MPSNEIFVSRLLKYHKGGEVILTKENLFGYIIDLCNQFKHFALCLEEFLGLPKNDQRLSHGFSQSSEIAKKVW